MTKIFIYGTLLDPEIRKAVYGRAGELREKTLSGYRKEGLNIMEEEGEEVRGGIIEVDDRELEYLNNYEGLGRLYKIINVSPEGEEVIAYQRI